MELKVPRNLPHSTLYTQNVTMDIFFQSPIMTNKQRENENMILTLEGIINFYALAETLKGLTIK